MKCLGIEKFTKRITGKCGEKWDFSTYNSTKIIIIGEEMNDILKSVTGQEIEGIKEINSEHIEEVDTKKVRERKLMVIKKIMKLQNNNWFRNKRRKNTQVEIMHWKLFNNPNKEVMKK